ncbi:expressed unknown protein [Seminavis robusta]|uniref:Uncharacterized protein n=1 Tax=Seminavis robusta TaxID=568900 RepID=A0A9N8HW45_9STRA|nr:expressed unknown protein [Seminavis robusta]|eukprot:Sro2080_g313730.1 n/a (460) ;mRNA; r:8142-9754
MQQMVSSVASTVEKESNGDSFLNSVLAKRPNWRSDFHLKDWLPRVAIWLSAEQLDDWGSSQIDARPDHLPIPMTPTEEQRQQIETDFWNTASQDFTFGAANIGLGHRLAQLAYSYTCNVVPNRKQQLLHWDAAGLDGDNRAWHYLFDDSPVIMGVPAHLKQGPWGEHVNGTLNFINQRRNEMNTFGSEPSAQEFYQMLRAQLKQRVKDKIASFVEDYFPKDELVIGVHIRAGNGKDDNMGHFHNTHRGDWLEDLPAAIAMVRKQVRMIAYSIVDRMNVGGEIFSKDNIDSVLDGQYRIFLATESDKVLQEFQRQDPTVLALPQERVADGEGVAIFQTAACSNTSSPLECAVHTQESMLMDMMILGSSCDAVLATSYSNFMYTLPATLSMAEGRIFCESGRAALGGQYMLNEHQGEANILGDAGWWAHPPPNAMPIRCSQGGWAARDRANLNFPQDVGAS